MKDKLKFIHCSDVHLGANPFDLEERFEDMGLALKQVFEFAVKEKVDFVIIAGDFFHNKQLNPKTLKQAIDILEILKNENIPVFLTEGNHDMETYSNTYSWLQFLCAKEYIYLLKPEKGRDNNIQMYKENIGCIYETKDAYILGLGYPGSTAHKVITKYVSQLKELKKDFNFKKPIICMLHTGINRFLTERMAGLKEEEIESLIKEIDYLALGHIHTRYENAEKKYFNPGSLECVRITDNPFNKGFYFVTMDTNLREVKTEFKIVQNRKSVILDIDVSKMGDINLEEEIISLVKSKYEEVNNSNAKVMLQVKLRGTVKIGTMQIDIKVLKEKIAEGIPVLYQEIINLIDYKDEQEIEIIGDFSRERVDELVITDKIKKMGFDDEANSKVYNIINKIKECGETEIITIDSENGKDIENLLLELVGEDIEDN